MKILVVILLLIVGAWPSAAAEPGTNGRHAWVRRATLAASCAASLIFDTYATNAAVSAGAVEGNALLAGGQGHPRWGLTFSLKAATCAGSAILQESGWFRRPGSEISDWKWTAINSAMTGGYTWVGFHNLSLARRLRAEARP